MGHNFQTNYSLWSFSTQYLGLFFNFIQEKSDNIIGYSKTIMTYLIYFRLSKYPTESGEILSAANLLIPSWSNENFYRVYF